MDMFMCNVRLSFHFDQWLPNYSLQAPKGPLPRWSSLPFPLWSCCRITQPYHWTINIPSLMGWNKSRPWRYHHHTSSICGWYHHILSSTYWKPLKCEGLITLPPSLGIRVNCHKSSIQGLNISEPELQSLASSLLCNPVKLPFIYLCLPIGGNTNQLEMWESIINRSTKSLPIGRATYYKSVDVPLL